jgi:hypothetical protein
MLPSLLLILLVVSLGACGPGRTVGGDALAGFAALGAEGDERVALVTLVGGGQVCAPGLRLTAGAATWINPETGLPVQVAAGEVVRVEFLSQEAGAGVCRADDLSPLSGLSSEPCVLGGAPASGPPALEGRGGPLNAPRVALADAAGGSLRAQTWP